MRNASAATIVSTRSGKEKQVGLSDMHPRDGMILSLYMMPFSTAADRNFASFLPLRLHNLYLSQQVYERI